jgi:hypothetical protein
MSKNSQEQPRSVNLTVDQASSLDDWSKIEECSEADLLQKIVDRGFVALETELNQRWINRDVRSRILISD